jgi:chemotaxis signal transduction protein
LQWQQTKQIKPHSKISQGTNSNLITGVLNKTEFQEVGLFIILMDLKNHIGENLMDLKDHTGENKTIQGTTINSLKTQGGTGHLSLQ